MLAKVTLIASFIGLACASAISNYGGYSGYPFSGDVSAYTGYGPGYGYGSGYGYGARSGYGYGGLGYNSYDPTISYASYGASPYASSAYAASPYAGYAASPYAAYSASPYATYSASPYASSPYAAAPYSASPYAVGPAVSSVSVYKETPVSKAYDGYGVNGYDGVNAYGSAYGYNGYGYGAIGKSAW